ncbi:12598_t:CDS:1, partial [Racocetra fulgida]
MSNKPNELLLNIDPQVKAYINNAYQTTILTVIDKVKELINQQAENQRCWNEQLQNTIKDHFSKLEQISLINNSNNQPTEEEQSNQVIPVTICSTPETRDETLQ